MYKILKILIIIVILFSSCDNENELSDTWVAKPKLSDTYRNNPVGFGLQGKFYMGLGWGEKANKDWWVFNPKKNKWTRMNDFPERSILNGIFLATESKGYVGLGNYIEILPDGSFAIEESRDIWEYDPLTDKWTIITEYPGEALYDVTAFAINDKIYIACGYKSGQTEPYCNSSSSQYLAKELWEYSLKGASWTKKENITTPMLGECYQPINKANGISAGQTGFLLFELRNTTANQLWRYDNTYDSWSLDPFFHVGSKQDNLSFVIGNYIYFGNATSFLWKKYNIDTKVDSDDNWVKNFPGKEGGNGIAVSINNKGYVFLNNGEFWEYFP